MTARTRPTLHAGLSSAMAHAPEPRPDAVRRHRSGRPRGAAHLTGGQGRALTGDARPPANAPTRPMANRSRCTASTPCSAISPPSPAMSSASGAIASPPSSPPPPLPSAAPSIYSHSRHRVDRPTPLTANYINSLRSKVGKVRLSLRSEDQREGGINGIFTRRAAGNGIGDGDS